MTLGTPSTGKKVQAADHASWSGQPPRDEFYWISQINKCTLVINAQEGLLEGAQAARYARALQRVIQAAGVSGSLRPKMYVRYEPLLTQEAGMEVSQMHAGRSSQDMHATFQRTILRDEALAFARALLSVRQTLWSMAQAHQETIVPCYTNGVAAQPNSLAHVLLGHMAGFERDWQQLEAFYARLNRSPMGSCVLNGTSWPLNRRKMAQMLGFDGPIDNAYDAGQIAATDVAIELGTMLMSPLMHVVQFIADVMVQYAQPRPWILVASTYASSAMPQKRNPGSLIDVRRDANAVLGSISSIFLRAHGLPPGMYDVKDVQQNATILREATEVMGDFAEVLGLLRINAERALEELNLDWTASQELADILMREHHIAFRIGHKIASTMVTVARENGWTPLSFPIERIQEIYRESAQAAHDIPKEFPLDEASFRAALDPRQIVRHRRTEGGPQPAELERQIAAAQQAQCQAHDWVVAKATQLSEAKKHLEQSFEALAQSFV